VSADRARRGEPVGSSGVDPERIRALLAPGIALVVMAAVAALTVGLLTGDLPFLARRSSGGVAGPAKTPTPSNVVVVDPRSRVPGTILYVKAGNIWAQSGTSARQLTTGGTDSQPAWARDGRSIYYVSTAAQSGLYPYQGAARRYNLAVPSLVRLAADGTGGPQVLLSGTYTSGRYQWSYFVRQPAPSPDGTRIAVLSDGPDPSKSDVVLQLVDTATNKLASLGLAETSPYGHQDPAWRPDGSILAYVRPGRDGSRGAATIWRYDVKARKATALTGPGYLQPDWSPDGQFLAATRSDSFGTDIVVLDAANGREILRLTTDERSFAPVWSPAGDAIAFLRVDGGVVDLVQVPVQRVNASLSSGEALALTEAAGLDAGSRPSWYIPVDQLPTPEPTLPPTAGPATPTPRLSPTVRPATPRPSR
jgi:Tol biopolymer transport system component